MSWKDNLYMLDTRETEDLDTLSEVHTEVKNNDIGMVNPISGVGVLATEKGHLEGFADYGLGFRFSRDTQSLSVFASSIHLFALEVERHDTVVQNTYLKDEYGDIDSILQGGSTE
jgi:hypothetical protein